MPERSLLSFDMIYTDLQKAVDNSFFSTPNIWKRKASFGMRGAECYTDGMSRTERGQVM